MLTPSARSAFSSGGGAGLLGATGASSADWESEDGSWRSVSSAWATVTAINQLIAAKPTAHVSILPFIFLIVELLALFMPAAPVSFVDTRCFWLKGIVWAIDEGRKRTIHRDSTMTPNEKGPGCAHDGSRQLAGFVFDLCPEQPASAGQEHPMLLPQLRQR
jgi:hypothetical protein